MRYSVIAIISIGGQLISLGLAFLFHFLMARLLGVALYGDFGVMLATFTIIFFPIISVQAVLMREVAKLHGQNKEANISWLITHYSKQGLAIGFLLALLASVALLFFHVLTSPLETLFILLSVPFFYGIYIFNSFFQGKQQPFHFVSVLVLVDLLRLVFALILVGMGFSLLGIGVSYLATAILISALIFILFYIKQQPLAKSFHFSVGQHLIWVFPTYALLSIFLVIDLFFVRYLLNPESAGLYNAALTLARGIFYASLGLMNAFLPQSSKLDLQKGRPKILRSLAISIGILLVLAVGMFFSRDLLLNLLYGNIYLAASPLLGILAFSMFFLSLSLLFINLMWSQNEQKTPFFLAVIAVAVGIALFYSFTMPLGIMGAAYASFASTLLLALLQGFAALKFLSSKSE